MAHRLLIAALALALFPAQAMAAPTVSVDAGALRVVAAPGDVDRLEIDQSAGGPIQVSGGQAGAGCSASASGASCADNGIDRLVVEVGDRDDEVVIGSGVAKPARIDGGPGDDVLVGNAAANELFGGDGDDVLDGGEGTDTLTGGSGLDLADYSSHVSPVRLTLDGQNNDGAEGEFDTIAPDVEDLRGGSADDALVGDADGNILDGGPGADTMSGRGGLDGVDYSQREEPVSVALGGRGGEEGEGDTLVDDIEGAYGGYGSDVLVGGASDGFLVGFEGDDVLLDRGGADYLDGGDDADQIDSTDGAEDDVACGGGNDHTWRDALDRVDADCELVSAGPRPLEPTPNPDAPQPPPPVINPPIVRFPVVTRPPDRVAPAATILRMAGSARVKTLRRSGLTLTVRCNEMCRASAELKGRRGVVASSSKHGLSGRERRLRLWFSAAGKRALRPGRYQLTVTLTDRAGNASTITRALRVK
jgi:RTX calcium-binding nonapeptide repeat (4 copies)